MPELPEVETVRRGLEPVMRGARFTKVEAQRGDLRWPLPKDFVQRLQGQRVERLNRRAKYLLADLSSGEVLIMHLGMSGSFHVAQEDGTHASGRYYHARPRHFAHDHVKFHMSSGALIAFNDPRRFGSLHFITFSCYRRSPLLRNQNAAELFERALEQTRLKYGFLVIAYVVMPEHVHILASEPVVGDL